ncbi:MAG: hypothetical protein OYL97_08570 [Candidatus Poribacteria bacterium]|nr:hypothetical protein [Candidatus Poribacteria bacterium]
MTHNDVMLSGPGCSVTLKRASRTNITDVMKALSQLSAKCVGLQDREIQAYIDSELEVLSGDGHDFTWELDFNSAIN